MSSRIDGWIGLSISWLEDMLGGFDNGKMTSPVKQALYRVFDDDEYFSLDCTLKALMDNAEANEIVAPVIKVACSMLGVKEKTGLIWALFLMMAKQMTLREILDTIKAKDEDALKYQEQLSKIKIKQVK